MNKFTAAFTFILLIAAVGAASRIAMVQFHEEDDNQVIVEESQPIVEILETSQNAINQNADDETTPVTSTGASQVTSTSTGASQVTSTSTGASQSQFINPSKAPSSPIEYLLEALYGFVTGLYSKVFG